MTDDLLPLPERTAYDELLDVVGDDPELHGPFPMLADLEHAERAMRHLGHLQREITEASQQAAVWHDEIDRWHASVDQPLRRRAAFVTRQLEAFAIEHRTERAKTVRLPSGEIATRRAKDPVVDIVDEAAVLEWAGDTLDMDAYADVVKTVESVRIARLRDHVVIDGDDDGRVVVHPATGTIVPGVVITDPQTTATPRPHSS